MKKFPNNFLWGAAMSVLQIEGHSLADGKSALTWDYWFKTLAENNGFEERDTYENSSF